MSQYPVLEQGKRQPPTGKGLDAVLAHLASEDIAFSEKPESLHPAVGTIATGVGFEEYTVALVLLLFCSIPTTIDENCSWSNKSWIDFGIPFTAHSQAEGNSSIGLLP